MIVSYLLKSVAKSVVFLATLFATFPMDLTTVKMHLAALEKKTKFSDSEKETLLKEKWSICANYNL